MLHAYVERFDVMSERENILSWNGEANKAEGDQCSVVALGGVGRAVR
jgi:hypothetical protein